MVSIETVLPSGALVRKRKLGAGRETSMPRKERKSEIGVTRATKSVSARPVTNGICNRGLQRTAERGCRFPRGINLINPEYYATACIFVERPSIKSTSGVAWTDTAAGDKPSLVVSHYATLELWHFPDQPVTSFFSKAHRRFFTRRRA